MSMKKMKEIKDREMEQERQQAAEDKASKEDYQAWQKSGEPLTPAEYDERFGRSRKR